MTHYQLARSLWGGTFGAAVRVMLSLEKGSGAWLWFLEAYQTELCHDGELTVGHAVRVMLRQRLAYMEELS